LNLPTRHNWPGIPVIAALLPSLLMRERMPLLQTLRIGYAYDCAAAIESFLAALPLISSSLTELDLEFNFRLTAPADDWLPGFHLLPSLRVLRCNIDTEFPTGAAFARSIALAPAGISSASSSGRSVAGSKDSMSRDSSRSGCSARRMSSTDAVGA